MHNIAHKIYFIYNILVVQHFLSFYVSHFLRPSCTLCVVGFCFHKYFRRCNTFVCLIKLKYFVCTMHTRLSRRNVLKQGIASQSLSFMICNRRYSGWNSLFFHIFSLHPSQPVSFQTALFASKIHFLYIENGGNFFFTKIHILQTWSGNQLFVWEFSNRVCFFTFFLFAFYVANATWIRSFWMLNMSKL